MKNFLKTLLASIIGSIIGFSITIILAIVILISIIAGIASSTINKEPNTKDNSVLILKLDYQINERGTFSPFKSIMNRSFNFNEELGYYEIIEAIKKAKNDSQIQGIYIETSMITAGMATIDEIREALLDFKSTGKFIVAFSEIYSQKSYYLASVADKVYLSPQGMLQFNGLSLQSIYLKGTLEKLGIEAQIFRGPNNDFKSGVEIYSQEKMSANNKLQVEKFVGDIWSNMLQKIAISRQTSVDNLLAVVDNFKLYPDSTLISNHIIDSLIYKDEVISILKNLTNTAQEKNLNAIELSAYYQGITPIPFASTEQNKIAIIFASGEMNIGEGDEETMGANKIAREIRKARRDTSIKAIVFRVNSGGGSALAAEIIWREAKLAAATKPFIASLGDLAASGGYYIVAPAQTIMAQQNTITGSIGVYGMIPNTQKLFNDKLGITFDGVKTNKYADILSTNRPMNPEEIFLVNEMIKNTYNVFISRVSEGRNIPFSQTDSIARGRVWSANDALKIGLIDTLGSLQEAIQLAASKANLTQYEIIEIPEKDDLFKSLFKDMSNEAKSMFIKNELGEYYPYLKEINQLKSNQLIYTRLPYNIYLY